jgi:hypothetical protein
VLERVLVALDTLNANIYSLDNSIKEERLSKRRQEAWGDQTQHLRRTSR